LKKPKNIQEIGFTGGVRSDQKDPALEVDIDLREIAPILKIQISESQRFLWGSGHPRISRLIFLIGY
jgi:hypothetical protein